MKIQYASDLHLEFRDNSRWLKDNPLQVSGDILVLAGDTIYLGDEGLEKHPFWSWASDNYKEVLAIPGNHELYKYYDINILHEGWEYRLRNNVRYCYNKAIDLGDDVELLMTTLWSKINISEAYFVEHGVSDFHRIMNGKYRLTYDRFNKEHDKCIAWLTGRLSNTTRKRRVVVTHHVPSYLLSDPAFKGSQINGAFTVELSDFIGHCGPEFWIYGHSHRNIDAVIGKTLCVSNQLGYVMNGEHCGLNGFDAFSPTKYIEL